MTTAADALQMLKDNDVKYVELRFTDIAGKEMHLTVPASRIDEDTFELGQPFDGSSFAGWRGIEASDMLLLPDPSSARMDPFREVNTIIFTCDVLEPSTGKGYARDPRSIAKRAEAYLKSTGIGDAAYFGPEPEFFIFDAIRWKHAPGESFYKIDSEEAPWSSGLDLEGGNLGHRNRVKGGYFPVSPVDSFADIRSEMCTLIEQQGVPVEIHHHEVGCAGQCEIGTKFSTLVERADWTQIVKYTVWNVAAAFGKTATFMPKPIFGIAGSGMHTNMSLYYLKDGKNAFDDPNGEMGLSETAYNFIAGIMAHIRGIAAFSNPTVNSYKRLVPGYEAPSYLVWSASNRSCLVRIPAARGKGTRVELRCPDPTCNPYLEMALCLAAGLDGIKNKMTPASPIDYNVFGLSDEELKAAGIDCLPGSLKEAIDAAKADPFIKETLGDHVFNNYIEGKENEWDEYRTKVSQWEIDKYMVLY